MNNTPEMLFGGLVAVVVITTFVAIRSLMGQREAKWERRLNGHGGSSEESGVLVRGGKPPTTNGKPRGLLARLDHAFEQTIEWTTLGLSPEQALAIIALAGAVPFAGLYLWRGELWLGVLGWVLGMVIALTVFIILRGRYREQLLEQIPDSFSLMARSLRAGMSMEQSITMAGEYGVRPLSEEYRKCGGHLQLGLSVPASLKLMANRLNLLDFDALVSTVSLHASTGGNLALLLDRLATGARDRMQFRGYFRAATALGRVTAVGMGLVGPALLMGYAIFRPEHVQAFFTSSRGWTTLGVALGLEFIGVIWLYNLLNFDY